MRPAASVPALILALVALLAGCGGTSDDDEVRDVAKDLSGAFSDRDYERACELFSLQAQSQVEAIVGGARGCATALGLIRDRAGLRAPSASEIDAARVQRSGDRATLVYGGGGHAPQAFTKFSDRWVVAPDSPATGQRSFAACWRKAGAAIATKPADLRFAAGFVRRAEAEGPAAEPAPDPAPGGGVNYIYATGWVIFYQYGVQEPSNAQVIRDPSRAVAVAYVRDPARVPGVVKRANEC
ncbi:MAG TPA: hypothetical protein VMY78_07430 [Solirubrobacteraceae bacterium]|nr:hypothetical protein [Solirubrobacteraceae bacterium]